MLIKNLDDLKLHAEKHSWELYLYNATGNPAQANAPNQWLHVKRKVKLTPTGIIFKDSGNFIDWPVNHQDDELYIYPYQYNREDTIVTFIKHKTFNQVVLSYHLRLIK